LRTRCYATRSLAASAGSTSGPLEAPARTSSGVATEERCSGSKPGQPQGAAPHAAALSSAADSARLHAVVHGTKAAPTARAAASGSGHGPTEAVEERGLRGHHVTAPAARGEDAAPSPLRPPPSRHHGCRYRGLRRCHRRSSFRRQHRTRVLTERTRAPIGLCKTRSYTTSSPTPTAQATRAHATRDTAGSSMELVALDCITMVSGMGSTASK